MKQVKEFINYQGEITAEINKWLKEQSYDIEVIDIKYSATASYSGALILYKIKEVTK